MKMETVKTATTAIEPIAGRSTLWVASPIKAVYSAAALSNLSRRAVFGYASLRNKEMNKRKRVAIDKHRRKKRKLKARVQAAR